LTLVAAAMSGGHDDRRVGSDAAAAPTDLPATKRVGIIGAGKLGMTLARTALAAGYEVAVASSRPAERIALSVDVLAPGAVASTVEDVADSADVIVLALPVHRFRELRSDLFDGKILVDAMNYWPDTDGEDPELTAADGGSSVVVQAHFPGARVVKSLNQLGYHELDDYTRAPDAPDRIAVAAVGDDRLAVRAVMRLIDRLGFDPVDGGPLAKGELLEPDGSPYAEALSADRLARRLSTR
jgi:predicted dinucleotide-binding enzyme